MKARLNKKIPLYSHFSLKPTNIEMENEEAERIGKSFEFTYS